eukprot:15482903-Alexandrium_andersonii.AAC.1
MKRFTTPSQNLHRIDQACWDSLLGKVPEVQAAIASAALRRNRNAALPNMRGGSKRSELALHSPRSGLG